MRKPRRLPADELAPYIWTPPTPTDDAASPTPIDWPALFGNDHPVEVEVGMGKGLFLLTSAQAQPGTNFFGIEIVRKYQLYATTRYAVRKLPNIKTACADAGVIFRDRIAAGTLAAVHVLFPDPWWKKRHRKRRVFTPVFAAAAARALAQGGRFAIASDVPEYFGVMTTILRAMPALREIANSTSTETDRFETNFERKAQLKGVAVGRALFERTAEPVTVAEDPEGRKEE